MRVLLVHNYYQFAGGEDAVLKAEMNLIEKQNIEVDLLIFDNKKFKNKLYFILNGLQTVYNFNSARLFKQKIAAFKPDIIHVHNFFPIASPSIFFVAKKFKIPIVMTLHNFRMICPSSYLFYNGKVYEQSIDKKFPLAAIKRRLYRDSYLQTSMLIFTTGIHKLIGTWNKKIDKYIVLTSFAKDKFLNSSLNVSSEKLYIKPNFTPDYGFQEDDRADYFIYVGRLSPEKGINVLIEALMKTKIKAKILGDGPLKPQIEKLSIKDGRIEYLGFQSKEKIINLMKKSRAVLFPSIWYEGMPMVLLECFSTGTPVIASNLGSIKEMITHKVNGLLFEPGNAKDLIEKINLLNKNPKLRSSISSAARSSYKNNYTAEKNFSLIMKLYNELANA